VGAANFFCVKDKVLYTPELTGTILPGITRDSIVQLARDLNYTVHEEKVDVEFAMQADEAFCAGTAAVISPIGRIEHGEKVAEYCDGEVGEITHQLYHSLLDIQLRRADDKHGWIHVVEV